MKHLVKKIIYWLIWILTRSDAGRYLHDHVISVSIALNVAVEHSGVLMYFLAPNSLTAYRAKTFSSKEPETLLWLESIPVGAVLWDVGANVGLYSIYAAKKRGAYVFSFEPSVFNLEVLARNIALNCLQTQITIFPIALNEKCAPSLFKLSSTAWGGALSSFGQDFDQHGGKLKSIFEYQTMGITMDDAVRMLNIPAPDFIKIDVDGIEHFILRGGLETLKGVESVMVEIDDGFAEQAEETARHLQNAGLTLLRKCGGDAGSQYNQWWVRGSA
jgi:FkbM family methyltransferase